MYRFYLYYDVMKVRVDESVMNLNDQVLVKMCRDYCEEVGGVINGDEVDLEGIYRAVYDYFRWVKEGLEGYKVIKMPWLGKLYPRYLYCWRRRYRLNLVGEELEYVRGMAIREVMESRRFKHKEDLLRKYGLIE